MILVQSRAILNYIATKDSLYGTEAKERALVDMYTKGILDLTEMTIQLALCPPDEKEAKRQDQNTYLPAYEIVLKSHGPYWQQADQGGHPPAGTSSLC